MDTAQPTDEFYVRWRSSHIGRIADTLMQLLLFELLGAVADKTMLDAAAATVRWHRNLLGVSDCDGARARHADTVMIAAARQRTEIEGTELIRLIEARLLAPIYGSVGQQPLDQHLSPS